MAKIGLDIRFDMTDVKADLDAQINSVFTKVLNTDIPRILKKHDLEDPDSYTLLLRNRGQTKRRQLKTIRPKFLKLGRNQPEFKFVAGGGNFEFAIEVALEAFQAVVRRAPYRSGEYMRNLSMYAGTGAKMIRMSTLGLRRYAFSEGESIFISSEVAYASTIEAGFYKGTYNTQDLPGGILHAVAKDIAARQGNRVAVSFEYRALGGGTFPFIRIGPLGSFSPRFARPGAHAARQARRKRG